MTYLNTLQSQWTDEQYRQAWLSQQGQSSGLAGPTGLYGESNLGNLLGQGVSSGLCGGFTNALNPYPQPDEDGWYLYELSYAPRGILLQFERRMSNVSTGSLWVGYADDFGPESCISGLYWRYTGIGRHQMDAL